MEMAVEERDTADELVCSQTAAAAVFRPQQGELASERKTHRPTGPDGDPELSPIARSARPPWFGYFLS